MAILSQLNDSGEWYTPHHIIDRVKVVMPVIDTDPATTVEANEYIGAKVIYSIDDDGLTKPWPGNRWCNPPYTGNTPAWARKWLDESLKSCMDKSSMLIVNANLGYDWFNTLFYHPITRCCLLRERLYFIPADGQKPERSRRASAIFYVGPYHALFAYTFNDLGKIVP